MHLECRHIKPSGYKSRSVALRSSPYYYFHDRLHRLSLQKSVTTKRPLELPFPEDRAAVLMSLAMIFRTMGARKLDPKQAGLFLYGLQIASQNVERFDPILPTNTVTGLTHTRDGQELGPKDIACDAPRDCEKCDGRKTCFRYRTIVALRGGVDLLDDPAGNGDGPEDEPEDGGD
jgi:hypothetical protein